MRALRGLTETMISGLQFTVLASHAMLVAETLLSRLDPVSRLKVIASFVIVLTLTAFAVLVIRMGAHMAKGYMHQPTRRVELPGDPFPRVIDSKPRPAAKEESNWRQRP